MYAMLLKHIHSLYEYIDIYICIEFCLSTNKLFRFSDYFFFFFTWTTVLPVDIIGYMSNTWRLAISSGKRAYTTLATCVSASDSTKIFPIRIDRQQSRRPCSIASPERTIETPQLPDWYLNIFLKSNGFWNGFACEIRKPTNRTHLRPS